MMLPGDVVMPKAAKTAELTADTAAQRLHRCLRFCRVLRRDLNRINSINRSMELPQSAGAAKTRTRTQGLDRQFFALPTVVAESVEELHRLVSGGSRMLMFCEDRYLYNEETSWAEQRFRAPAAL